MLASDRENRASIVGHAGGGIGRGADRGAWRERDARTQADTRATPSFADRYVSDLSRNGSRAVDHCASTRSRLVARWNLILPQAVVSRREVG
jgi:hypothetical protein